MKYRKSYRKRKRGFKRSYRGGKRLRRYANSRGGIRL